MATKNKPDAQYDALFQRESLTLKEIINIARGAPLKDWPPPEPFLGLFRDLKHNIGRGELPVAHHQFRPKFDSVPAFAGLAHPQQKGRQVIRIPPGRMRLPDSPWCHTRGEHKCCRRHPGQISFRCA